MFGKHHPILIVRSGSRKGKQLRLRRDTIVLGADSRCQVVLKDPGVEKKHATLRRRDGDQWELENHSADGTQVDKLPIQKKRLRHGAQIRLGQSTLLEFTLPNAGQTRSETGKTRGISPRVMVGIGIYWLVLLVGVLFFRAGDEINGGLPVLTVAAVEEALAGTRAFLGERRAEGEAARRLRIDPDAEAAADFYELVYREGGGLNTRVRGTLRINAILDELERLFQAAWHLESQRRWEAAAGRYREITRIVPDIRCPATALATERLRRLREVLDNDA